MTPKQSRFCAEYLIDSNATQAAIRSGYSKKTARRIGTENVQKPAIRDLLAKKINKQLKRCDITADRVLWELADIAFLPVEDATKKKISLVDKKNALELLAKHFKLLDTVTPNKPGGGGNTVVNMPAIIINNAELKFDIGEIIDVTPEPKFI